MSNGPAGEPPPGSVDELRGPTVLRMILGTQLRRLREAVDVTPDQAGYEIRASRSKISRMEHGRVGFKDRDVADLLTLYGISDEQMRARMLASVRHAAVATPPQAARSPSCASLNQNCRTSSISSSSPARCTWTAART
ncbi:MAG TPA: helix-turn-helix transcriptional regulator [Streptosporangiaceae bacterium]|nr:helix-turn-helix transcriptional regulator [Streptosporangiaceae bacterium]